ncbi:MAG: insulinase family protein [Staphylococcus sp.]|nr:insulinase family protein [Staphylococcus sp.]
MSEPTIHHATLSNGLRIVCRFSQAPVVHCGVVVNAGSRDETPDRHGIAHFVEHTIFKGTDLHRAAFVRDRMEVVGGELNAYTTKEETVVYSTFPYRPAYVGRAFSLLGEMIHSANFPESELSKEKLVVGEEIDTYLDTPSDSIFDDFEELIYAGSPMAHNILGTRDSLANFTSADCRRWLEERFSPGRMVLFFHGPHDPAKVFALAEKHFGHLNRPDTPLARGIPPVQPVFRSCKPSPDSFQAHTVLGARIPGLLDPGRIEMALLTNMLGGPSMNSLLNVALRERHGLVYTIDASAAFMSDNGLFTIYFGCERSDIARCLRLVKRTIDPLADSPLSPRRLEAAKRQFVGQLTVSSINSEQEAISMARSTLYRGRVIPFAETAEAILAITPLQMQSAAQKLTALSHLTLR